MNAQRDWTRNKQPLQTNRQPCEIQQQIREVEQELAVLKAERHNSPAAIQIRIQALTTEALLDPMRKGDLVTARQQLNAAMKNASDVYDKEQRLRMLGDELLAANENIIQGELSDLKESISHVRDELKSMAKDFCRKYARYVALIKKFNRYQRGNLTPSLSFSFDWMLPHGWQTTPTSELIETKSLPWLNSENEASKHE